MKIQTNSLTQNVVSAESSDAMLVQNVLTGDENAFTLLVQRYSTSLFTFICRFLNDYDAASDTLQHVWTQCYLSLDKLDTGVPLKPWLFQVARNRCLDELRRKRGIPFSQLQLANDDEELSVLEAIADPSPLPEELAEQHDLQAQLQAAIDTLPVKYRSVVLLRYSAQMSFREIAETLTMPEATAKTYFQRSKPLLRTALTQRSLAAVG